MHFLSLLGLLILNVIGASADQLSFNSSPSIERRQDDYRSKVPSYVIEQTKLRASLAEVSFSSKLTPGVAETESSNYVFSPLSSYLSLHMAAYGARAATEETLEKSFGLKTHVLDFKYGLPALIDDSNYNEGVQLSVANSVVVSSKLQIQPEFSEIISQRFLATVQTVDLEESNEANNEKIGLGNVPADGIALCMMNNVTFKGQWMQKFDVRGTKQRTFYVDGVTEKKIPTMSIEGFFLHGELPTLDAAFVQLPFRMTKKIHNMSMIIIVPKARDGVVNIEKNFGQFTVQNLVKNGNVDKIYMELPKVRISSKIDIKEAVSRVPGLDIDSLFDSQKANFTGITEDIPIFPNRVVQNSIIEIDEEGCEAVATMGHDEAEETKDATPPPLGSTPSSNYPSIIADHPFYALIVSQNEALHRGWEPLQVFTVRFNG